jgi:antitoxin ParD1/3/4
MSNLNLSLEQNQLKITIKEIILELFSEPEEEFSNLLVNKVIEKVLKKKVQDDLDLEESADLYAKIYKESNELQQLTESALLDFVE